MKEIFFHHIRYVGNHNTIFLAYIPSPDYTVQRTYMDKMILREFIMIIHSILSSSLLNNKWFAIKKGWWYFLTKNS